MAAPQGVTFDGMSDYLTRGGGLTGAADSELVTGALWFKTTQTGNTFFVNWPSSAASFAFYALSGQIVVNAVNADEDDVLFVVSSSGSFNDGYWHHVMFSFDMSDPDKAHLYVDDTDEMMQLAHVEEEVIPFSSLTDCIVGANTNGGAQKYNGDMADVWLQAGTYIDLSVEANRRKFVGASAASSVDLGSDGSNPTGSAPIIFLSGATASWHTNKGTGGGFTENGALTDASSNPPDYGGGGGGGGIAAAVALYHARHHNGSA